MSKHTPGPWKVMMETTVEVAGWSQKQEKVAAPRIVKQRTTNAEYIAVPCVGDGITMDQQEANARLIAAAPDLLEALKDSMQWLCGFAQGTGDRELIQATGRFKEYEAAIAKAEGK